MSPEGAIVTWVDTTCEDDPCTPRSFVTVSVIERADGRERGDAVFPGAAPVAERPEIIRNGRA
jgi:hypothetical protein